MFNIHSVSSDRDLIFSSRKGEYFHVELKGHDLSVSTDVWVSPDVKGLNVFFQEISSFRTPWQGVQGWASLDGEFEISATSTSFGHVIFLVKFAGQLGETEEWKVQVRLDTELGQLESIARNANLFFKA